MAQVTVDFDHAIYEPFSYVRGTDLAVAKSDLDRLLTPADRALDRSDGFFFDTIDGQFVFGFEQDRTDRHSRNQSEGYFDLFVAPVESVEGVKLDELHYELRQAKAASFTADVDGTVTVDVESRAAGDGGGQSAGDGFEFGDGADEEWVDERKVAEMWEHLRRDSVQLYRQLWEVDEFVAAVDGALQHVSYVSAERNPVSYFDFVDEVPPDDQGVSDADYAALEELVATLQSEDRLVWDELPTYRDELDALRERHETALSSPSEFLAAVEAPFEDVLDRVQGEVRDHGADAASLYGDALDGAMTAEDDDGTLAWLTSTAAAGSMLLSVPVVWLAVAVLAAFGATRVPVESGGLASAAVLAAGALSGVVALAASVAGDDDRPALLLSVPFAWLATASTIALSTEPLGPRLQWVVAALLAVVTVLVAVGTLPAVTTIPDGFDGGSLKLLSASLLWVAATAAVALVTRVVPAATVGLATAVVVAVVGATVLVRVGSGDDGHDIGPFLEYTRDVDVDPAIVEAVDEEMQAATRTLLADIETDIEADIEDRIATVVETQSGELAREIVENVAEAEQSVAYEQVHDER